MREKNEVIIISEETIHEKIYNVRGYKVMLDFELAEIYGYTTTRFNEQVKNNIEKLDDDFMFELTKEEVENLMFDVMDQLGDVVTKSELSKMMTRFTDDERIFLCGAASKDAGARVSCIVEDYGIEKYKELIEELLKNES